MKSQTLIVTGMMLGAGAHISIQYINTPIDTPRYGSGWHKKQHEKGWNLPKIISGSPRGYMAHVRAVIPEKGHVKVFGHVCNTCGYVDVIRTMDSNQDVEKEVYGGSTIGYTWTTANQIDVAKIEPKY
jgi:hypothetical protein